MVVLSKAGAITSFDSERDEHKKGGWEKWRHMVREFCILRNSRTKWRQFGQVTVDTDAMETRPTTKGCESLNAVHIGKNRS